MRAKCNQGGFENNENIEYNGQFLRSKNEFIVCQALDKLGYFVKSEGGKEKYFRAGFGEFRDVIFFRLNDARSFDLSRLISLIGSSILANMNDIVLP